MTLFAFRGAKSHEWTFCDTINNDEELPDWTQSGGSSAENREKWFTVIALTM